MSQSNVNQLAEIITKIRISRGHRKTNLFDETEYPDIQTSDGVIRTSYLAAVLRLADEIDVGVDRNPELLFDTSALTKQVDIDAFGLHKSIRMVEVMENATALMIPGLFVLPVPAS